jgi:16S rRNA (guanine527-N7)-methyltransferase
MTPEELLAAGIAELASDGLTLPNGAGETLVRYLTLLDKWNRTFNLTAVRDRAGQVTQHLLDSLAILPVISLDRGSRVLDVGSGAGVPGIPLAVARPDCRFTLLDSSSKKTAFMRQAQMDLGLRNVEVVCCRIEEYRAPPFDVIVSRAFAQLADYLARTRHLVRPTGRFIAMKGVVPEEELGHLGDQYQAAVHPVRVPGLDAARCVVIIGTREQGAGS